MKYLHPARARSASEPRLTSCLVDYKTVTTVQDVEPGLLPAATSISPAGVSTSYTSSLQFLLRIPKYNGEEAKIVRIAGTAEVTVKALNQATALLSHSMDTIKVPRYISRIGASPCIHQCHLCSDNSGVRCNTSKVLRCKHRQGDREEVEAAVVSRPGKTQLHGARGI